MREYMQLAAYVIWAQSAWFDAFLMVLFGGSDDV